MRRRVDEELRRVGSGIWIVSFGSLFSLFGNGWRQRDIELPEALTNLWYVQVLHKLRSRQMMRKKSRPDIQECCYRIVLV